MIALVLTIAWVIKTHDSIKMIALVLSIAWALIKLMLSLVLKLMLSLITHAILKTIAIFDSIILSYSMGIK